MTSGNQLRLTLLVVLALTPVVPLVADAPAAEWHPFGLQGIAVRSLAAAPGSLCAGTAGRGVFCLDMRGKPSGWRALGPEGTTIIDLWIDERRPGLIFATADAPPGLNVVYRTLDGGQTWVDLGPRIPPSSLGRMIWIHGAPGESQVFGAGGGFWKSDDLGETWTFSRPLQSIGLDSYQSALEVAPTDPRSIWIGGDLAFTFVPQSYMALSRDGGLNWEVVWSSGPFEYTPVNDISANPRQDGVALTGQGGYALRTLDHGATFRYALQSPAYFLVDWGGRAGNLAFAAGNNSSSPTVLTSEAWISLDMGENWKSITGSLLARLKINDLAADERLAGVAFAATNDGVHAFLGAGGLLCHDARQGVEKALLWLGECPPIMSPGPVILGDAIVASSAALRADSDHVDLGAVYCVIENSDVAFATLDLPDPPVGEFFMVLAREDGTADYGVSSDGLPRRPATGDCH